MGASHQRCHLLLSDALQYMMPNDVFNDFKRDYHAQDGWLTIDGLISLIGVYGGRPSVRTLAHRQIDLAHISYSPRIWHSSVYKERGFLRCGEISLGREGARWYDSGETVYDVGAVLATELTDGETVAPCPKLQAVGAFARWSLPDKMERLSDRRQFFGRGSTL